MFIKHRVTKALIVGLLLLFFACSCQNLSLQESKSPSVSKKNEQEKVIEKTDKEKGKEKTEKKEVIPTVTVDFIAFGDFMLHNPQLRAAETSEGYDFSRNFIHLKDNFIQNAHVSMINLETTLTDGSNGYTTFPVFSSPKEVARDFKNAGFNIISTANNHSYDKLQKGVDSTIEYLEEQGLEYIGTNKEDSKPKVKDINGMKLGFISYTYGLNGFDQSLANSEKPFAVNILKEEKIVEDCQYLKDQKVDAIIAFVHWGNEYQTTPSEYQRHFFEVLSNNGVILTFGSHPHVMQGVDMRRVGDMDSYVAYSMGNFVSNQRREYMKNSRTETGLMVRARLHRDETGKTRVVGFTPSPIYVDYFHQNGKKVYEVIPVEAALNGEIPLERMETIRPRLEESMNQYTELIPPEMLLSM